MRPALGRHAPGPFVLHHRDGPGMKIGERAVAGRSQDEIECPRTRKVTSYTGGTDASSVALSRPRGGCDRRGSRLWEAPVQAIPLLRRSLFGPDARDPEGTNAECGRR